MSNNKKMGRPSLGITKKVSITLRKDIWEELDRDRGNLPISAYLRDIITNYQNAKNKNTRRNMKMINVKNDWTWVNNHVDEELENETLFDDVHGYMQKHNIDLERVKELYHDGLSNGIEEGKYLPFSQWFYELSENEWE